MPSLVFSFQTRDERGSTTQTLYSRQKMRRRRKQRNQRKKRRSSEDQLLLITRRLQPSLPFGGTPLVRVKAMTGTGRTSRKRMHVFHAGQANGRRAERVLGPQLDGDDARRKDHGWSPEGQTAKSGRALASKCPASLARWAHVGCVWRPARADPQDRLLKAEEEQR